MIGGLFGPHMLIPGGPLIPSSLVFKGGECHDSAKKIAKIKRFRVVIDPCKVWVANFVPRFFAAYDADPNTASPILPGKRKPRNSSTVIPKNNHCLGQKPQFSSDNLARLAQLSASMGIHGHDLEREVREALRLQKRRSASFAAQHAFQPRRRCKLWSPVLGAGSQAQKVILRASSMCWHDGAMCYATCQPTRPSSVLRWKPGDAESQVVAGRGAAFNGVNDLGPFCRVYESPEGVILVANYLNGRLLKFENGSGTRITCL